VVVYRRCAGSGWRLIAQRALTMGNPSNATASLANCNNYLMEKPTYSVSYNATGNYPNLGELASR
jgi:hypothetical protein